MNKNSVRAWGVLGLFLIVYQVLAFAIPFPKTAVFWCSYIFTDIALLSQIYVFRSAFSGTETVKSKFYGFPIARIGVVYAVAQILLGFAFMTVAAKVAFWIPLVLYVLMFSAAAVGMISSETMRDEIVRQDDKLKKDVSCMRRLQSMTVPMAARIEDDQTAAKLKKLAEDFRFSDPVSSEATADSEHELSVCIDELQQAVVDGDTAAINKLCVQAETLLAERNRICKLNK